MDRAFFLRLLTIVCSAALAHRAYAGIASTSPDSVTGLYVPGWADNPFSGLNVFNTSGINLGGVSHAYYAFLWIESSKYTVYDPFDNLKLFMSLKSRWPATKFLLSIGGGGFSTAIWNRAATTGLTLFVDSAIKIMKAVNADGIDVDWETPDSSTRDAFTRLCATLRSRLDAEERLVATTTSPRHYWLTAATQAIVTADSFDGFNLTALKSSLDLFNIMTYSMHDPCYWETKTHFHTAWSDCTKALDYYLAKGVPRSQLVLGLAFYGHVYTLADPINYMYPAPTVESRDCSTWETPSYRAILRELADSGGGVFMDVAQRSAYYVRDTRWITFDIPETMALKIQGIRAYGIGGVMVWDASLDLPDGSLLRAVATRQNRTTRPCGYGYVGDGVCSDTSLCCSEWGYCGKDESYCGPMCRSGPCIPYPSPPPRPPPPVPYCGNGIIGSGVCTTSMECCSSSGYCGTSEPWCGVNCVGGPCWYKTRSPPPSPRPPPKPAPPPPLPQVTYGCGNGIVGNGTCPIATECCSSFGWCGNTPAHCAEGCKGGPYFRGAPPPPGEYGPMCGGGVVGNRRCTYSEECCSSYGYCGYTADHCGVNCMGGACWYPPPPSGGNITSKPSLPKPPPPPSPKPPQPAPKPPSPKPPQPAPKPPSPKPPQPVPKPPSPQPPSPKPPLSPTPVTYKPPTPRQPAPKPPFPKPPQTPKKLPPLPSNSLVPCGNGIVGNGKCSDPTLCCSYLGFCARSEAHCYWSCVGGPCWEPPPPPPAAPGTIAPPSPPPPAPADTVWCGDGRVGNKQCRLKHYCCSSAGYCGFSETHCLTACVGGPCWKSGQRTASSVQLRNATI